MNVVRRILKLKKCVRALREGWYQKNFFSHWVHSNFETLKLQNVRFIRLCSLRPQSVQPRSLRDYILKSWLYPAAVNVCNRKKGGENVCNFLSFYFLSAVVSTVLSKDRLSVSRPWKLTPTGIEVSSFLCSLFSHKKSIYVLKAATDPTNLFPILKLQNSSHNVSELHKIRRSPDLKGTKIVEGFVGKKCSMPDLTFHNFGALISSDHHFYT